LQPPISKDVSTSGVTTEEEAIFKAQQLDLIYAQSGMLYHILPDAPRSTYDPRKNPRPHADGILGSANVKYAESVTSHLKELSLNQPMQEGQLHLCLPIPLSRWMYILCNRRPTQMVTNNQAGIRRKGHNNNRKGGKNNNKPKDNGNNEKMNNNVGEGKKERCKVKFPCNLCTYDHLTHLCPKLVEVEAIISTTHRANESFPT
jgi:hypothetical protein